MNNLGDLLRSNMNPPKPDVRLNKDQREVVRQLLIVLTESFVHTLNGQELVVRLSQLTAQNLSDRLGLDDEDES